jgi:hypothetical protein
VSYRFVKGHGTENDFVVVPGDVALTVERVRALCDRRAGIGGAWTSTEAPASAQSSRVERSGIGRGAHGCRPPTTWQAGKGSG